MAIIGHICRFRDSSPVYTLHREGGSSDLQLETKQVADKKPNGISAKMANV